MIARSASTCCPFCGFVHDLIANANPKSTKVPENGDVTLCFACGEYCELEDGRLVIPSDQTYDEINADPDCAKLHEMWLESRQKVLQ